MDMGHKEIAEIYRNLQETPPLLRLDVYPSQFAPVFVADSPLPQYAQWGFDGPYGKQLLINARAETVDRKPFFAADFARRRCAIPCSAFYEWEEKDKHLFASAKGEALYLAGFCKEQDNERFVVLTKPAAPPVDKYHCRVPALLDKADVAEYLCDERFALEALFYDNVELTTVY